MEERRDWHTFSMKDKIVKILALGYLDSHNFSILTYRESSHRQYTNTNGYSCVRPTTLFVKSDVSLDLAIGVTVFLLKTKQNNTKGPF